MGGVSGETELSLVLLGRDKRRGQRARPPSPEASDPTAQQDIQQDGNYVVRAGGRAYGDRTRRTGNDV